MRPQIKPCPTEHRRSHLVEKDKWPNHAALCRWHRSPNLESVTEITRARHDNGLPGLARASHIDRDPFNGSLPRSAAIKWVTIGALSSRQ